MRKQRLKMKEDFPEQYQIYLQKQNLAAKEHYWITREILSLMSININ